MRKRSLKYEVGDRVRCYREAPEGATGTVVATRPQSDAPYKVRWDQPNPFTGAHDEKWVSRQVVYGPVTAEEDWARGSDEACLTIAEAHLRWMCLIR